MLLPCWHRFCWHSSLAALQLILSVSFQAGKVKKPVSEQEKTEEGLGPNIKSIVTMLMLMLLMMFAVHCTWVTSNAYSSPSVVLASYNHDG